MLSLSFLFGIQFNALAAYNQPYNPQLIPTIAIPSYDSDVASKYQLNKYDSWDSLLRKSEGNNRDSVFVEFFSGFDSLDNFFKLSLSEKENAISKTDSNYVKKIQKKSLADKHKDMLYNRRKAMSVFNEYKDAYLEDLRLRSKESGREIIHLQTKEKTKSGDIQEHHLYYLDDDGVIHSKKCTAKYIPKNNSREEIEKQLKDEIDHICFYPKGYEEAAVILDVRYPKNEDKAKEQSYVSGKVYYLVDIRENNTHVSYKVAVNNTITNIEDTESINLDDKTYFDLSIVAEAYDLHYAQLNQQREDIKNGMFEYDPESPNGYTCKDRTKWKSFSKDMIPTVIVASNVVKFADSERVDKREISKNVTEDNR